MGVGSGLYMYDVVVKRSRSLAISSSDELLSQTGACRCRGPRTWVHFTIAPVLKAPLRCAFLWICLHCSPFWGSNPKKQFWGANRRFEAKHAKSINVHIIKATASIPTKFCTVIKAKCPSWLVANTQHKSKMADSRLL